MTIRLLKINDEVPSTVDYVVNLGTFDWNKWKATCAILIRVIGTDIVKTKATNPTKRHTAVLGNKYALHWGVYEYPKTITFILLFIKDSLSELLLFVLENTLSAIYADKYSFHWILLVFWGPVPDTDKDTWHAESKHLYQSPKCVFIIINSFFWEIEKLFIVTNNIKSIHRIHTTIRQNINKI